MTQRHKCIVCNNRNGYFESITDAAPNLAWPLCAVHSEERCKNTLTQFSTRHRLNEILKRAGLELELGEWIAPPQSKLFNKSKENPIVKIFKK